jgi:hypothetical protein
MLEILPENIPGVRDNSLVMPTLIKVGRPGRNQHIRNVIGSISKFAEAASEDWEVKI